MFEEFKSWFQKDWLNIFLTIFCALIPFLPHFAQYAVSIFETGDGKGANHNVAVLCCQFAIAAIGLLIVSFRYKPTALLEVSKSHSLQDYIEDVCRIKQTRHNDSGIACEVVRRIVKQFYNAWIIIWVIWLLYFGVEVFFFLLSQQDCHWLKMNISGILFLFDFLSSCVLFCVYII